MGVKLVIQIPAYNEADHIIETINKLPKSIDGIDRIEYLVINDASTDNTRQLVGATGMCEIVNLSKNDGLGVAFKEGLKFGINCGADIIVNTDGDGQYRGDEITALIRPILDGSVDMVIGNRQINSIPGYPLYKIISQNLGNFLVTVLFGSKIYDTTSGFRALNRGSAEYLIENLENSYTYTLESICLLLRKKFRITFIPIKIKFPTRESRLIKSKFNYVRIFLKTLIKYSLRRK